MNKKLIAIILCFAILTTLCLSASATTVTFGGTSSGGSLGTKNISALVSTHNTYAYYASAGFYADPSQYFTLDVVGHLYVNRSPMGNYRVVDCTMGSWGSDPALGNVNIAKFGAETNYPVNNYQNQFNYQKVIVNVTYNSQYYGSWSGSGQMNY